MSLAISDPPDPVDLPGSFATPERSAHPSSPELLIEWGERGAEALAPQADVIVVVDVLSFSTCVDVAVSRGVEIIPCRSRDGRAAQIARQEGAELAGPRGRARFSLSPRSFEAGAPGLRVVLPSPNGATVALAVEGRPVLAGCLRNAGAVARHARTLGRRVLVVPAGERWPDGELRPCLEDWIGAGAILDALDGAPSPEVSAARAAFHAHQARLEEALLSCPSGRELVERGYPQDVSAAAELNVSGCVPILVGGAFKAAAPMPPPGR